MKTFEQTLALAESELTRDSENCRPQQLYDLVAFKDTEHAPVVETFWRSSFQKLKTRALESGDLISEVVFDTLAHGIARWQNRALAAALKDEFVFVVAEDDEIADEVPRHYELGLTAGTVALSMAALGYQGELALFDSFLESYEPRYAGEDFVMRVRYAQWILKGDEAGALAYLTDPDHDKGLGLAACALADLDARAALEPLKTIRKTLKNPVSVEVFTEAIQRLMKQGAPPAWSDRMIHLFGIMTPTECALTGDDDNEFVLRARQVKSNPDLGRVHEVDDSTQADR